MKKLTLALLLFTAMPTSAHAAAWNAFTSQPVSNVLTTDVGLLYRSGPGLTNFAFPYTSDSVGSVTFSSKTIFNGPIAGGGPLYLNYGATTPAGDLQIGPSSGPDLRYSSATGLIVNNSSGSSAFQVNVSTSAVTTNHNTMDDGSGNSSVSGNATASGSLQSGSYVLGSGPDASILPVVGGQSVITAWHALQLRGDYQSNVTNTPSNVGSGADSYMVVVPPSGSGANLGLLVGGSQTSPALEVQNTAGSTTYFSVSPSGAVVSSATIKTGGYTVSTLPTGTTGMRAYVTDQTTSCPSPGGSLTGGGSKTCPVFYDGAGWKGD